MRLLVLCGRFLELHRIDLDTVFSVSEVCVESECVGRRDVA
jgi:hypothetical protein